MNANTTPTQPSDDTSRNDEPEITQEESVPLDDTDKLGEKMMEDLGRDRGGPGTAAPKKDAP